MLPFTDTHCHLDFERYDNDREETLQRAWKAGLVHLINPGIDPPTSKAAIELAQRFPGKISAAVGIHPNYGQDITEEQIHELRALASAAQVVAIGEIGLDYYRPYTAHDQQQKLFRWQLALAAELNLPVIIHNRDASQDLLPILAEWQAGLALGNHPLASRPGVLHSYSDDLETAQKGMAMNFMIGIGGPVTFTNAPDRKAVVRDLPLDRLLLETDAPFLTPHPHRGKRNEPAYIPLIAEEIARLHDTSPKAVAEITYQNAHQLFQWKE